MRVLEITDAAALEALRPEWSDLLARCPEASPFLTPQWLLPWWRHLGGGELLTLALRDGPRLVALAPLFVHRREGRRRLGFLGGGISDELDLVCERANGEEAARLVVEHLCRRAERWDACALVDLPPGSPLVSAVAALGAGEIDEIGACQALELPATTEEFLDALGPSRRRNLRRSRRLLEAKGGLRLERAAAGEVEPALEDLFRLHGARWAARGERGVLATQPLQAFHRKAASGLASCGVLRLRRLFVDGAVAAALYGMARGRRAFAYLAGFDPGLAQASPGTLLTAGAIEDSIHEGLASYDFLRGDEPYKSSWGVRPVPRLRVRLRPCDCC